MLHRQFQLGAPGEYSNSVDRRLTNRQNVSLKLRETTRKALRNLLSRTPQPTTNQPPTIPERRAIQLSFLLVHQSFITSGCSKVPFASTESNGVEPTEPWDLPWTSNDSTSSLRVKRVRADLR
jgi:hypothetical protein